MSLFSLGMTCWGGVGKLRNAAGIIPISLLKKRVLSSTSRITIAITRMEAVLFPCQRNIMYNLWVNPDCKLSDHSCHSNTPYVQRVNSRTSVLSWKNTLKPPKDVFYIPIHTVEKDSITTTKIRAIFDTSVKSTSGVSLNMLLLGPTLHPHSPNVLLQFWLHKATLTTYVGQMYLAVEVVEPDPDLHQFIWRQSSEDFCSSTAWHELGLGFLLPPLWLALEYPQALDTVNKSFYMDDGLTVTDSVQEAIELQDLFSQGGFLLSKWNSSEPSVLQHLPHELKNDPHFMHPIPGHGEYTKTLGIEQNANLGHFCLSTGKFTSYQKWDQTLPCHWCCQDRCSWMVFSFCNQSRNPLAMPVGA